MNNSRIFGIVIALILGGAGGYYTGQTSADAASAEAMQEMLTMMQTDGMNMAKAGGMMMEAGALLEDRGVKYKDQDMVMMGKDLSVFGKKHEEDGKSMAEGDMMGMHTEGDMHDMHSMHKIEM